MAMMSGVTCSPVRASGSARAPHLTAERRALRAKGQQVHDVHALVRHRHVQHAAASREVVHVRAVLQELLTQGRVKVMDIG